MWRKVRSWLRVSFKAIARDGVVQLMRKGHICEEVDGKYSQCEVN
jgi:hypothetical protein